MWEKKKGKMCGKQSLNNMQEKMQTPMYLFHKI